MVGTKVGVCTGFLKIWQIRSTAANPLPLTGILQQGNEGPGLLRLDNCESMALLGCASSWVMNGLTVYGS